MVYYVQEIHIKSKSGIFNMSEIRTRFAPSPTGFMHVGNLRTALYAWLLARSGNGRFVLRIEDTDQNRYVEGAVDIIYSTLKQAGIDHDEGPDNGGDYGPYIQSERKPLYKEYAEKLVQLGGAYYCFCEKCEEQENEDAGENKSEFSDGRCPGHCDELSADEVKAKLAAGVPFVVRQRIDRSGSTGFQDAVFGEIEIENKVLDDQILLKQDGMPTYNFANVIDDHLMGITHVVRGCEYLSSTPKYNLLYKAFGWEIPTYVHLPLIMGKDAEGNVSKLSKRHGSVSFENLVEEGFLPEAIVNYIAFLGWNPKSDREIFSLAELAEAFSLAGLNKAPAVFDYTKLRWMNSEHLKMMEPAKFAALAKPFAAVAGTVLEEKWPLLAELIRSRIETLTEIPEKIAFFHQLPEFGCDMFNNKKSKCTPETAKAILEDLVPKFEALEQLVPENVNPIIEAYANDHGVKLGQPMWAVRISLSGLPATPGGPAEIMSVLGKEESMRRLKAGLAKIG